MDGARFEIEGDDWVAVQTWVLHLRAEGRSRTATRHRYGNSSLIGRPSRAHNFFFAG